MGTAHGPPTTLHAHTALSRTSLASKTMFENGKRNEEDCCAPLILIRKLPMSCSVTWLFSELVAARVFPLCFCVLFGFMAPGCCLRGRSTVSTKVDSGGRWFMSLCVCFSRTSRSVYFPGHPRLPRCLNFFVFVFEMKLVRAVLLLRWWTTACRSLEVSREDGTAPSTP